MTPTAAPAYPPTPTPIPLPSTPPWIGPHISLWDFTSSALQVWNTAGPFVVGVQAVILLSLVVTAVAVLMIWLRRLANRKSGGD